MNIHNTVKEMFHLEVSPALGCSKPATICHYGGSYRSRHRKDDRFGKGMVKFIELF